MSEHQHLGFLLDVFRGLLTDLIRIGMIRCLSDFLTTASLGKIYRMYLKPQLYFVVTYYIINLNLTSNNLTSNSGHLFKLRSIFYLFNAANHHAELKDNSGFGV